MREQRGVQEEGLKDRRGELIKWKIQADRNTQNLREKSFSFVPAMMVSKRVALRGAQRKGLGKSFKLRMKSLAVYSRHFV